MVADPSRPRCAAAGRCCPDLRIGLEPAPQHHGGYGVSLHRQWSGRDDKALSGGRVTLEVLLHYTIALLWTAVFVLTACKFAILTRQPVVSGLRYGVVVYLVMNLIVPPLSGDSHPPEA